MLEAAELALIADFDSADLSCNPDTQNCAGRGSTLNWPNGRPGNGLQRRYRARSFAPSRAIEGDRTGE